MPQRERITITIRKDLLANVDRTIDHQQVRNRSHALEVLLSKVFIPKTHRAVILASGEGVSMRPFTYEIPKPLIPVNGKPLLHHSISRLRDHGITDITITVSHLAEKIQDYFKDGSSMGVSIQYVREKKPSGTAGALRSVKKLLSGAPFLMMYGDVLVDLGFTEFLQAHQRTKQSVGTLALTSVADPSAYGSVKMRGTHIVEFSEKPTMSRTVSRLVFAGVAAFDSAVFDFIPSQKKSPRVSLEKDVFPRMIAQGKLYGYPFEGQWFDVSTPEVYEQALKHWKS